MVRMVGSGGGRNGNDRSGSDRSGSGRVVECNGMRSGRKKVGVVGMAGVVEWFEW